jgi:dUTP pyrophosphatase
MTQHTGIEVKVKLLRPHWDGQAPDYSTEGSAGIDLRACLDEERTCIAPGGRLAVPTGLAIEIGAPGVAGFVFSRSGLGTKQGLVVSQGVGVIDPDYRGEIIVSLLNTSGQDRFVERGQRIAQLVFMPYCAARLVLAESLAETARGAGGFGHTGTI